MTEFEATEIPSELAERPQWLCWSEKTRNGKTTKIPQQPDGSGPAKANDMGTWGRFQEAVETARKRGWGIGFVFADAGPYCGVDLDGCLDGPSSPADWLPGLDAFVNETYIERSPSGDGLHIICQDETVPDWWTNQKDGDGDTEQGVEVYDSGRFFTFTGDTLEISTESVSDSVALEDWLETAWDVFNDDPPRSHQSTENSAFTSTNDVDGPELDIHDVILSSAHPEGERVEHPFHGSSTGANFMVNEDRDTWRCWRHGCTGNAHHLLGMEMGVIDCGDWLPNGLSSDTWHDIYNAARDAGYDIAEPDGEDKTPPDMSALADGGVAADDGATEAPEPPAAPGGGDDEDGDADGEGDPWQAIYAAYRGAEDATDRIVPRHESVNQLTAESDWRTLLETDEIYHYDKSSGIYRQTGEADIRERLVAKLNEQYRRHEQNEIAAQLRGRTTTTHEALGGPDLHICTENCVLEVTPDGVERHEHDPEYEFLGRVQTDYDPDAECPRFMEFLDESVERGSDRKKLQEFVGYTLHHWGLPFHKALFLVGPTASGKSTFLDTVRSMLGDDAVASLTPQQMTSERFGGAELFGKWANIRNDIPTELIENTGQFKELVAGDPIKAEKKYEDPFMFEPAAKHMFSANELPKASTDDRAFYRRILLIAFPNETPKDERDPGLTHKLAREHAGILNWALEGLQRLIDEGHFTGDRDPWLTEETWQKWADSADRFRKECLETESGASIPTSKVWEAYLAYCSAEGIPQKSRQQQLTKSLKKHNIETGREYNSERGTNERVLMGVQLTGRGEDLLDDDGDGGSVDRFGQ